MNDTQKVIPRERVYLLNEIAERDKLIDEQKAEIEHYRRQYEIAVRRKVRERHDREERRKDIVAMTVLLFSISFVFIPMIIVAFQQTFLWASGM